MLEKNNQEESVNQGLKLLAKSSVIVFVGLFLSKIFTYIYRIIIARYFGPEVYGLFSLAIMIMGLFIVIFSFGFIEGIVRFIPLYRGKKEFKKIRYLLKLSIIVLFFSSLTAAIILFFSAEFISLNIFHNSDLIIFLKIFSFLIPLLVYGNFFLSVLRGFEKIAWHSFIFNILQNLIKLIVIIFLIFLGIKSNAIIFSHFAGILIVSIFSFLVCKYKLPELFVKDKFNKKIKFKINKEFILYSLPVMFTSIFSLIFSWIDSFSIGYFMGALEVGFYNAAIPIVLLMTFVPELFKQLFFPLITREFSSKKLDVVKELSQQVGKWIFIFNLPLFLLVFIFPGAIINILFGAEYLVAENALRILSVGFFVSSLIYISTNLVSMVGKSKIILINVVVTSIINIILNFILVPIYGINGAAISTTIVWILLSGLLLVEAKHYTSIIPIRRKMLKIFFVSLIPLVLLLLIKQFVVIKLVSLILLGGFFFLSYLFLIFITNCFDKNDFMILRTFKRKILKI